MKKTRKFRIPNKLPRLKQMPKAGDLVAIQDLDSTVFPVLVLKIEFNKTKKGKDTKVLKSIHILSGNTHTTAQLADLRILKDISPQ
jgi:hypothetical protein